ncbi:peptidase [Erythrobacter longus]|uniref:Peptidase n=1 Tax=Erythrobacter longus TaxID=1044 RepID=A0A074MEJ7_ERYLO|nr:M67 family metallopeptidase [Erythrobacter longus]KEO90293.1 peptidase [Erythrobacter longus]
MTIEVTREVLDALGKASLRAYPREACGILLGEGARIMRFVEAANVHQAPETHFEVDPQTLIDAHRSARKGDLRVLGYFHSHPKGPAKPSKTDQRSAAGDGKIWAIAGEGEEGGRVTFWRDQAGGFEPLSHAPIDG